MTEQVAQRVLARWMRMRVQACRGKASVLTSGGRTLTVTQLPEVDAMLDRHAATS